MKLSATQQDVLDKMRNGWELARSNDRDGRWWIQRGGTGYGGEVQAISHATALVLFRRGLIASNGWDFPTEKFHLKES